VALLQEWQLANVVESVVGYALEYLLFEFQQLVDHLLLLVVFLEVLHYLLDVAFYFAHLQSLRVIRLH